MKAAVRSRYGPPEVVSITAIDRPTAAPGEIVIRVYATTVNRTDCALRQGRPWLWRLVTGPVRPRLRVLGCEYAGEVESIADDVTRWRPGDQVFGFQGSDFGAHAEYLTVKENGPIALMPTNLSYEQAVPGSEGSHYALTMIRGARIEAGHPVLVYGATGAIGSAAVQLLHGLGAQVTAVCDEENLSLLRDLGADEVIGRADFDRASPAPGRPAIRVPGLDTHLDGRYYAVLDTVGKSSFGRCRRLLRENGVYISADLGRGSQNVALALVTPWLKGPLRRLLGGREVRFPIPHADADTAAHLRNLMQDGTFRPLVDRSYALDEIVEAHRYVDSGRKLGNVVMVVRPQD
ncbi:NAD(P)-dependent alcohol dehydrogenase [Kineosporia sp. NBRC 101731]|uniref:NAD(P)-dependent alcohol dehydrogenase n=1 Tax=Kineosporia sp. NBRC 101731 TaxID=3032199 RepID=UPI0024A0C966|nr:NAD(P)-dependent alcohol dehydrogenase [Kineosporia sp. NBRC 101731]GLY26760.1 NADPH:quinone oxidoreductase [Kineosporia sp. NBRC 101731]